MNKSSGSIQRSIFPFGYKAVYSAELTLAPTFISVLYDRLLHSPEIKSVLTANPLENLKGRDPLQQLILESSPIQKNELLLAEGTIFFIDGHDQEPESQPFRYSLQTPYSGSRSGTVLHTIESHPSAVLPEDITVYQLGRIIPAELTFFRFGIQRFTNRVFSSLVGFVPAVSASLLIDCSSDLFLFQCSEEGLRSKTLPWANSPILGTIHSMLSVVCDFDLLKDIAEKLQIDVCSQHES